MHQNLFGSWAPPGPAGNLQHSPDYPAGLLVSSDNIVISRNKSILLNITFYKPEPQQWTIRG